MLVYKPKHKKSLNERLTNSIIHDELVALDSGLELTDYTKEELEYIIEQDKSLQPMAYYEDEILYIRIIVIICLLATFDILYL